MALYKESDNSDDPALRKQVDASGDKLKAAITPFVENGKAVASSPSDQGLITAWRMSANKLLEIVGEVTRLFAELNMYGYDSLARAAAGAAGNGNSATGSLSTSATAHPGGGGEYSMEKIKMSYDKLDFSRPAENLKPHYHSSSTLRSSKSKEFTHTTPKAIGDQESLTASNEPMVGSGYTPIAILNDPSARKCSSGHLSQAAIPQVSICTVGTVNKTFF